MKPLKLAVIALGVILALVLGLVAFILATFDSTRLKAELAKAVQEKTQRTLSIDGDLGLTFWPNVGIRLGKASLSEFRSDKEFAAIEGARVSVAVMPLLSKQVVVNTVELNGARVILVKHKDGTLSIADLMAKEEPAKDTAPKSPVQIDVAAIRIADAKLSWHDEQSGQTSTLSGLDLATGRVTGDTGRQAYEVNSLSVNAKGQSGSDSVELTLAIPKLALAGDAAQTLTIDRIEGSLGLASPRMPMKSLKLPLSGQLRAELAKQSAQGTLSTRFDESNIALKFDVAKFSPLSLGFDLEIDRLNVDKYLPPAKPDEEAKAGTESAKGDKGRIDLSALKGLSGIHGTVRIGQLQVNHLKASDLKLRVKAAAGKLDIAPHSMKLYNGTLAGAMSANADGNVIALREDLSGISIDPLLKDLANKDLIEGHGDVRLDVTTRGETVSAMKKGLAGSVAVALRDGAIKGINLAQSFREAKALLSSKQDAVQQAKATDKTDFSEMTASFRIAGGIAHNEDLAAKSPFLRLAGAGDIDIGNGTMNYLAKASIVETSGGQGAKDLEHLRGVTVPVRATGPFDKLAYKIEYAAIAEGALKAKVDEKKQELKQKAKEELLKGLFGK